MILRSPLAMLLRHAAASLAVLAALALPASAQSGGLDLHQLLGLDDTPAQPSGSAAAAEPSGGPRAQAGDDRLELRRLLGLPDEAAGAGSEAPATPPRAAEPLADGEEDPFGDLDILLDMPVFSGPRSDATTHGRRPLKRADLPGLDRRVLTLPEARLHRAPGEADGSPLPAFSIFYVYGERQANGRTWLELGRSSQGAPSGWVPAADTEDWKTMLVMEYAPKGGRERVLFFERGADLAALVRDPLVAEEAALAYAGLREGDPPPGIVAVEPEIEVDPDRPYLMPILDSRGDLFDSLEPVTLVQVAGLTLDGGGAEAAPAGSAQMRGFRYGIVFAIDTTSSMGGYIDRTRSVVHAVIDAFEDAGLSETVDFGLVGFRDDTSADAGIGYVTRVYQPLDPAATVSDVLANFRLMAPTPASTRGFDEDAFAGIDAALNRMDWSAHDFRMVVLITDAGPRRGTDPRAAVPGYDVLNIRENAERKRVALSAIHLLTPEARRAGNIATAREVYTQMVRTGDATVPKYFAVDAAGGAAFDDQIGSFARGLVQAVAQSSRGERVERRGEVASLGDAVVNEVFRAQLEYLGDRQGQGAPAFARAWAADRDLTAPSVRTLNVKVFLTRQQLSGLMEGSEAILAAYEEQRAGGGDFFQLMRAFSAQTSVEGAGSRPLEEAGQLFPSFLEALPYKSDFLALDPVVWSSGGPSFQREITEVLRQKLRAYRDIAGSATGWIDLGAGQRAEDVYAVSLDLLP